MFFEMQLLIHAQNICFMHRHRHILQYIANSQLNYLYVHTHSVDYKLSYPK